LIYSENRHANTVVERTAQLWQLTPTSYETEKAGGSKRTITGAQPFAIPAIQILTKEAKCPSRSG